MGLSIYHWLFFIISGAIVFIPVRRILNRAQLNNKLAFFAFIPGVGWIFLMTYLAFSTWPNEPEGYR